MKAFSIRNKLISIVSIILIWWVLSKIYPPIVIPKISAVLSSIAEILKSPDLWIETGRTFYRLFLSLLFGVGSGVLVGFFSGINENFRQISKSYIKILQVVPPVSILILTIIWLGYNGKPAIAIAAIAVFPTIVICVQDGILGLDLKMLEMAEIYKFSKTKTVRQIIWPSIKPQFFSGLKIAIGSASKTVVMGEVLTTVTGIGGQLVTARLNIEPEKVIAWTVISVFMYVVFDRTIALIFRDKNAKSHKS